MARERAAFFSPFEQEIILKTFEEYKAIITAKCNTAAAAKSRVEAWQRIADRLNATNPNNVKRTWQQVKIKYKNIVQCANRKRKQKFGEVLAAGFSPAEEVALWQIRGRPVIDGTILGLSSGVNVGRPVATEPESSSTLIQTAPTILDCAEEPIEGTEAYTSQEDPGPSGPSEPADAERDEDVTALYKRYLRQEIAYRQLKMKKLQKEIQLLDKQLDVS
ncbi:GT1 domain-containing protein [Neoarius graeffei]|uniref:GT1 domain-containing protein n=1 Tax=Neoarius graeffei TaxID=443677 RepID=UPI00298C9598|nr:GT1 domain-containing protein [Neoarius graeffei]